MVGQPSTPAVVAGGWGLAGSARSLSLVWRSRARPHKADALLQQIRSPAAMAGHVSNGLLRGRRLVSAGRRPYEHYTSSDQENRDGEDNDVWHSARSVSCVPSVRSILPAEPRNKGAPSEWQLYTGGITVRRRRMAKQSTSTFKKPKRREA